MNQQREQHNRTHVESSVIRLFYYAHRPTYTYACSLHSQLRKVRSGRGDVRGVDGFAQRSSLPGHGGHLQQPPRLWRKIS